MAGSVGSCSVLRTDHHGTAVVIYGRLLVATGVGNGLASLEENSLAPGETQPVATLSARAAFVAALVHDLVQLQGVEETRLRRQSVWPGNVEESGRST